MDIKIELIQSVGKIATFIMVLLSVFLFTVKTNNKLANRLFGVYLLVIAFDLIGFFTTKTMEYPNVQLLKLSSSLLQLPLFYLYVLAACFSNFKLKAKHILHGLPFLVFVLLYKFQGITEQTSMWYDIVSELQFIAYMVAIFLILKRYKTIYLENYANANYAVYTWLFQISLFACIAHAFVIVRWLLSSSNLHSYVLNINIVISLCVLAITVFFVLNALYKPSLFTGVDMNIEPVQSLLEERNGVARENLDSSRPNYELQQSTNVEVPLAVKQEEIAHERTEEEMPTESQGTQAEESRGEYEHILISFMEQEKPYLDSEVTLQKLSKAIGTPEKELSIFINHHLGKHFFDFINEYRISDALELLKDTSKNKMTVQEIFYEVGFNSKSSFYTAFKKLTSQTPTQYRKQHIVS